MLKIVLPKAGEFEEFELTFEHSLVSLSKWEAIHEKPFYNSEERTQDETRSYAQQMLLTPNVPPEVFNRLNVHHYNMITSYINSKQTATTFHEREQKRGQPEAMTAELIYYWMISFHIPFDPCETWHLNKLLTLIRVTGVKSAPPKKMTKGEWAEQQRRLNAERREKLKTNG